MSFATGKACLVCVEGCLTCDETLRNCKTCDVDNNYYLDGTTCKLCDVIGENGYIFRRDCLLKFKF